MSALTDLFSAMATKIRSKTGTATTYTPSEMVSDGIDDVYDAGVASATTPITPSNSSPASMTANTGYKPTANGYAIASYDSVTPSSTPESVASGDMVKIGGSGVIVDAIPTPTSITPSNSSPVVLTADTPVNPTSGGYAIASYDNVTPSSTVVSVAADDIVKIGGSGVIVDAMPPTPASITPSNATPAALTADTPVTPTANGYAIASYSSVTPSNAGDLVSSGDIVKFGGSGVVVDDIAGITPSNANPVQLYTGQYYGMGDDGYAIASYSTATPSNSSPAYVEGGKIYKIGGNLTGYVIDHYNTLVPSNSSPAVISSGDMRKVNANGYAIESYTSVTPSNSSPVALTSGDMGKIGGNGYAIESYSGITPSNSSPVSLSSGSFYKPSASGYAISSYSNKTPSDTSPASVSSGAIIKASSAGYLVKNTPVNIGVPDVVSQANMNGNASRSITVTKTPRYVIFLMTRNSDSTGRNYSWFYDVAKGAYSLIQYTADGYSHSENTGAPTAISATSSSVTVTNTSSAVCRTHALIYY